MNPLVLLLSFFFPMHAQGLMNPRTGAEFTDSEGLLLDQYIGFNALHRSRDQTKEDC
jgi:hypothetical protein